MESSRTFVLEHKETGLYISHAPESYHTKSLKQARKFINQEQIDAFMKVSNYRPDNSDDYEPVPIITTIVKESAVHANTESGTEKG